MDSVKVRLKTALRRYGMFAMLSMHDSTGAPFAGGLSGRRL
jgi:hypothetical protein